jgi:spermidine/putrescine transport system substrate-binding protein
MFEYAQYCYEAEDDEEETVEYDLSYFFSGDPENADGKYVIEAPAEQLERQLYGQYPPADVIGRSSIMTYFNDEQNERINQMWINVRCFDIRRAPWWSWILILGTLVLIGRYLIIRRLRNKGR